MIDFLQRLKQRKLVQWAIAYVAFAFALLQGVDVIAQQFGWPESIRRGITLALVVGFFVMLVLAWYHGERGTQRVNGTELLILALMLALGGGFMWRFARAPNAAGNTRVASAGSPDAMQGNPGKAAPDSAAATATSGLRVASALAAPIPAKSVAVLPFENLSTDKGNAYFADGMQDLILTKLADIGDLKVISRTSTEKYKSHPDDLKTVGQQLGVATILEGSVQKAGNQVLINVQLIDAKTDAHIWAQSYQRTLDNIFGVEGEVAQKVATALNAKLTTAETARVNTVPTTNAAALNAYLLGQYYGNLAIDGNVRKDFDKAIGQYSLAVKHDPKFALAWAHLAFMQLTETSFYGDSGQPGLLAQARANFERALAIEPDLAFALIDKAWYVYVETHDLTGAQKLLAKAHALKPQEPYPLFFSALFHVYGGQWDAALEPARKAAALDPRNEYTVGLLGEVYTAMRRYREALPLAEHAVAIAPESVTAVTDLAQLHWVMGNIDAAKVALDAAPADVRNNPEYQYDLGYQLLLSHDYAAARALHAAMRPTDDLPQWSIDLFGGNIEWQAGQRDAARRYYQHAVPLLKAAIAKSPKGGYLYLKLAWAYARLGRTADATHEVMLGLGQHASDARNAQQNQLWAAQVWAQIGDDSKAIAGLEHLLATPAGMFVSVPLLKLDPVWDPIRHDPAFQALLEKYGKASPAAASTAAPAQVASGSITRTKGKR